MAANKRTAIDRGKLVRDAYNGTTKKEAADSQGMTEAQLSYRLRKEGTNWTGKKNENPFRRK